MQEKLIEILSNAKGWLPANKIADIGGWRSAANVGVALGQMEKANGSVVRRKSPTVRMNNGMPATEWKLAEKNFGDDKNPAASKPVVKESFTTAAAAKTPDSSPVEQKVSQGLEMFNLRQQLKHAEEMRDSHFERAESAERRVAELLGQVRELQDGQKIISAQIDGLFSKLSEAKQTIHSMELEAEQAKSVTEAAVGYIVRVVGKKPRICMKPESARTAALASARAHGRADVLALVPVGKAVRGAEWKEAEAA